MTIMGTLGSFSLRPQDGRPPAPRHTCRSQAGHVASLAEIPAADLVDIDNGSEDFEVGGDALRQDLASRRDDLAGAVLEGLGGVAGQDEPLVLGRAADQMAAPDAGGRAGEVLVQRVTKMAMAAGKSKAAHIGMYQTGTPRTPST